MFTESPRCQVLPLPGSQVAFGVDGRERLRWHFGSDARRPFLYPMIGPAGLPLTRMGHPGAPNHDHHRSIWFAHHRVLGIDFWSENTEAVIRQDRWIAYQDGEQESLMGVLLKWYDGHNPEALIEQQVILSVAPDQDEGLLVEIQSSLTSVAESLELGQTNFGLLAVRVAKSISAIFGDGVLTGADGTTTEKALFGNRSAWIDYSGSIDRDVREGITYFDHPQNGGYPSKWHVRDDGWMGASICRDGPLMLRRDEPTLYRYLLHGHAGDVDLDSAASIASRFAASPKFVLVDGATSHHHAAISRG